MSVMYYDRLIVLEGLDKKLKKIVTSNEELQELWKSIEEIVHHRVMGCVLDKLPREKHSEFLEQFHETPHDEKLLKYLKKEIKEDVEEIIKKEVKTLHKELLADLKKKK
jgi:hypothetical protein